MVEVIFFDAVGTLFGVRGSVGQMYQVVAQEWGVEIDPQVTDRCFYQVFQAAPPMAFPGCPPALIPEREYEWWYQRAVETFQAAGYYGKFTDFDRFFQRLYDFFAKADPWEVYPETAEVLTELQRRGYRLAVISNFDSRLFPVMAALGLSSFFARVIISTQVGGAKPDRLIFQTALAQLQVPATQALHVGDSRREDYEGAIGAGLQAFWLQRPHHTLADVFSCLQQT
ncbi:MAG: HAD-IA family hydrolase [Pseudanabaenaceae cyanobacterium SKYGB_i_bin29]|nr:HAD-IA family hydrolase [Pseudanabaenaceae cyanobacterium SKYG29]MDW8420744.1 HAD-IA family hydrolase [Pseudanabaenaceae cyanobacterium SKYGB_i_bin29]